jgi:hypothetical protein
MAKTKKVKSYLQLEKLARYHLFFILPEWAIKKNIVPDEEEISPYATFNMHRGKTKWRIEEYNGDIRDYTKTKFKKVFGEAIALDILYYI